MKRNDFWGNISLLCIQISLCLLLLSLGSVELHAIPKAIDSLTSLLAKEQNVEKRIYLYNELAFEYLFEDLAQTKLHAETAMLLAKTERYELGIANAESRLGAYFQQVGAYDSAIVHHHKCLGMRLEMNEIYDAANTYNNLGNLLDLTGEYERALEMFEQALAIYETDQTYIARVASTYNSMSEVYLNMSDYEKALTSCLRGLDMTESLEDPDINDLANCQLNLGSIYLHLEKYDNALATYAHALTNFDQEQDMRGQTKTYLNMGEAYARLGELDKANMHFEEALTLSKSLKSEEDQCKLLLNIGSLAIRMGKYQKAKNDLSTAIDIAERRNDRAMESLCWSNMAAAEYHLTEYREALSCYRKSLSFGDGISMRLTKGDIYEDMGDAYTKLGIHDSANIYFQLYNRLRDTVLMRDRNALELEKQLEVAKKERKNKEIKLQLVETQASRQSVIILALIATIILLATSFFYFTKANKEKQKAIVTSLEADKNVLAFEKKIDDMLRDQESQSIQRLFEGQEVERERIAADLHDRLGALLAKLKWNVNSLEEQNEKQLEKMTSFTDLNTLIDETVEEVRYISHNMATGILDDFGVDTAIADLVETFQNKEIDIQLFVHNFDKRLTQSIELGLYRIAQEAIGNALKHAKASEITIQLNRFTDKVNLLIEDNGKGFDPEEARNKKGLGLKNIQNRAKLLGGKASIDSQPKGGTTISVDIPFSSSELQTTQEHD